MLVRLPADNEGRVMPSAVWDWVRTTSQARYFPSGATPPWDHQPAREPLIVAPIIGADTVESIGGIYIVPRRGTTGAASQLPAVQSLAAQIASTLHSAQTYAQTLAHERVEQELVVAGEIQASFLPEALPDVPGWQLAATLEPARQTSGDFYDLIPLPNGRLGILIADVADKGTGAALYMALSRTLIRTYAVEHHARPDFTLRVANNRILTDAGVDLFVTAFYGALDPLTGRLTYCNAGHPPPLLIRGGNGGDVQKLTRTGLPLGVFPGESWAQSTVQLEAGDVLVLYTDGITEAQDRREEFFGEKRLVATVKTHKGASAQDVQSVLMREVRAFSGDVPQYDDIAVMILVRGA
jgi:sigma-B regulation protein RsbU (phosphoserine phosphatase)